MENEARQVLWDYDAEEINWARKLIKVLTKRFGGTEQAYKYWLAVKYRTRKPGELLRTLHEDTRKLVALAFPKLEHKARKLMACDYFIDLLNDPNLALTIRKQSPKYLDSALNFALQLYGRTTLTEVGENSNRRNPSVIENSAKWTRVRTSKP